MIWKLSGAAPNTQARTVGALRSPDLLATHWPREDGAVALQCAACSKVNPGEARFCMGCGQPLAAEEAPARREVRRVVTVVFADMVGFTALGERLDQESLRRVMDRFYVEMRSAIEAQGGTLAKFIGDAVLAVWGTPEVREDDALRAVRAAELMRRSLGALNEDLEERWGVRVGMRTGVNTGEVVVDPTRPADLLVGDTLNVAARLEQAAGDGEVLVGPGTFRLVRDGAMLEATAPLNLKGKSRPMPAWRLVDGLRAEQRASTRLVGRAADLARLVDAFSAATETGHFGLVTVIGSPGLGKTRLVAELARVVGDRADVLQGRCESSDEGITFLPVAEVLRAAAGIDEQDGPEAARERLAAALAEDEPQRERIVERAGGVLGLAAPATPEETFWGVRRFLEARARRRPLLIVLDDIHWGQPTFLDLVEHLAEWGRAPVLIVALARPELRETRPSLTRDAVDLAPLDATDSRALIEAILGTATLPPELEERVLDTTDGNPFFLGEVLRMLVEERALTRDGDTWTATDGTGAIAVPPTIHALLAARIERLAEGERDVVERAAVIGHQFYRGAVAELTAEPVRSRLDEHLDTLRRKDLVRPEELRWLDEDVFRFHHVLIRDAAYRRLLKEARAELHERFATWLDAKAGALAGEHDEIIAFHLEQAHAYRQELGPLGAEGRALARRATERLHSAGRRALAREDLPAAINLLHRALRTLGDEGGPREEVLIDLAEALVSAGDTTAAEQIVEELGLGADEAGDARLGAWATALAGQLDNLTGTGHVRDTVAAAAEAAAILDEAGDHRGAAKAHHVVAQAEALLGRVAAAEAALDRALVAARAADDRRRVTAVLSGAPRAALWGPTPIVRASGRCLDVVRILRMTPGNRHVEAAALRCQAVLEAMRGRAGAARGILDGCRTTFRELGLGLELHETDVYAGIVELLAGEDAAAEERLAPARDGLHALGVDGAAAQASALLARALLGQRRREEAMEATHFAERHGGEDLKTTIAWLGVRAEALALRGDCDEARALAARAVALAEPTDALADKADALMALAAVELAAGDASAAARAAHRAQELYLAKDHAVGAAGAEALAPAAALPPPEAVEPDDMRARLATAAAGRTQLRFADAYNARDWEGVRATFADDYHQVDRRAVGWEPIRDAEGMLAFMQTWAQEAGDVLIQMDRVVAIEDDVLAGVLRGTGTFEGGAFEIASGTVSLCRDGRFVHAEVFEADDDAGMLEAFERFRRGVRAIGDPASSGSAHGLLANLRAALLARDWDRVRAAHAVDAVRIDHRPGRRNDLPGRDRIVEFWQSVPLESLVMTPFVERAPWLLATHLVLRGTHEGSAWEAAVDEIIVLDAAGRLLQIEGFEPDDGSALLARLDELEAQGPPSPVAVSPLPAARTDAFHDALRRRDWERIAALCAPDVVATDRRRLVGTEVETPEGVVHAWRSIGASDTTWEPVTQVGDWLSAVRNTMRGRDRRGIEWETVFDAIMVFDRLGRAVRYEPFDPDDRDALLARVDELRAAGPPATLTERTARRWEAALATRDITALEALYMPDAVYVDHRPVARDDRLAGAEAHRALLRGITAMGPDTRRTSETIAARGDRHRISRMSWSGHDDHGGPWELITLAVVRVSEDGRLWLTEMFAPEDERLAHERLDELADPTALELGPHAAAGAATRVATGWIGAFNRRDPDAIAALVADDFVFDDHRTPVRHSRGKAAWVKTLRETFEDPRDSRVEGVVLAATDRVSLVRQSWIGRRHSDELVVDEVARIDEAGRLASRDVYEPGAPAAWARYEQLAAQPGPPPALVEQALARWSQAFAARDFGAIEAVYTPDVVYVDRRPMAREELVGAQALRKLAEAVAAMGPDTCQTDETLALRGERHCLSRGRWSGHDPSGGTWENETLAVIGVSEDGRISLTEMFAIDDEEKALARLDELAGRRPVEHGAPAEPLSPFAQTLTDAFVRALMSGDWGLVRGLYAPDFVLVDRRRGIRAEVSARDDLGELWRSVGAGAVRAEPLAQRAEWLVAVRLTLSGTGHADVEWESVVDTVFRFDATGRLLRMETFEPGNLPLLLERLDELEAEGPPLPLVERTHARWRDAFAARDWAAIEALYTPDALLVDHRPLVTAHATGPRGFRDLLDSISAMGADTRRVDETLALRGTRHRLTRLGFVGHDERGGAFELDMLAITVVDEDGLIAHSQVFSPDDERAAHDRLDELADPVAIELGPLAVPGAATAHSAAWFDAFNRGDLEALAELISDELAFEDHRPLMRHTHGKATYMDGWRQTISAVHDVRVDGVVLVASGRTDLATVRWTGRRHSYEIVFDAVGLMDEQGRVLVQDLYERGDPAAWERYRELAAAAPPTASA